MKCWVCKRQAGICSPPTTVTVSAIPAQNPIDWVFCSRSAARTRFHALYGNWLRTRKVASTDGGRHDRSV